MCFYLFKKHLYSLIEIFRYRFIASIPAPPVSGAFPELGPEELVAPEPELIAPGLVPVPDEPAAVDERGRSRDEFVLFAQASPVSANVAENKERSRKKCIEFSCVLGVWPVVRPNLSK